MNNNVKRVLVIVLNYSHCATLRHFVTMKVILDYTTHICPDRGRLWVHESFNYVILTEFESLLYTYIIGPRWSKNYCILLFCILLTWVADYVTHGTGWYPYRHR